MNQQQKIQNPHRKMVKRCEQAAYRRGNKKDYHIYKDIPKLTGKKKKKYNLKQWDPLDLISSHKSC